MTFAIWALIYHLEFVQSSSILYMKEAMPDLPQHAFYQTLENAQPYLLRYHLGSDDGGPIWNSSGSIEINGEIEIEPIEAVSLGNDLYGLAEICNGPFSFLQLRWGDEFFAHLTIGNELAVTGVKTPLYYQHYQLITSRAFSTDDPLSEIIHQFSGGWEVVTVGMLTITVPMAQVDAFELEALSIGWNLRTARLR